MTTLTQLDQEAVEYAVGLMKDGENHRYDFRDDGQYRAAVALHNLGGHTPETRPGMHKALEETRERHIAQGGPDPAPEDDPSGFQTGAQVTDISRLAGTQLPAANGFTAVVDGALQLNATIAALNTDTKAPLARGAGTQMNQGECLRLFTNPLGGVTAPSKMTGVVSYAYQKVQGGPWTPGAAVRNGNLGVLNDPVVTHPNKHQTITPSNYIRIALGRGLGTQNDVDYWYWYGTGNTSWAVPFYGYVDFSAAPLTPLPSNVTIFAVLAKAGGAGGYKQLPAAEVTRLLNNLALSGSGNTRLNWTLAPGSTNPPWSQQGNPLNWGNTGWEANIPIFVTIQFSVPLTGQVVPAIVTVQSSTLPDPDPLDGTTDILPLQFVYSCLVAGTPVRLGGDGSTIAIEEVVRGSVVRCGDGKEREVLSTAAFDYRGEVLRVATDAGHQATMSPNHLVITADGQRQARELEVGAEVRVEDGTAKIAEISPEPYDGKLWNLSLTGADDKPDPDVNSVYAGGLLVGDYELQETYDHAWRTDPDRVRALLGPDYAIDYSNYLEELAAHA